MKPQARAAFERGLCAVIERRQQAYGSADRELPRLVAACVEQILATLDTAEEDGRSLTALEVVRIRAGKFAASKLPAALYSDPQELAALRAEIHQLGRALLGDGGAAQRGV